ncbi:hypothetical protein F7734_29925 [Scytonema sp. UIC 10036]|uniref:hypothetical protein n=1 Tax=Scytonema sp. UIC 10036 TaxID=2304196 RepID=UPI0012DA070D|nr:hypothetical protein [Scytonema sp. UIC 10036]MUG96332.1 hypothetical protein [Scytonema sp. UIC 10036]
MVKWFGTIKRPDRKYEVKLTVLAEKLRFDEKGHMHTIAMDEKIDIGVLGKNGEILYRQKHRLKTGENTITVLVDTEPKIVGVDPLNMLVNRVPDSNMISVIAFLSLMRYTPLSSPLTKGGQRGVFCTSPS